MINHLTIQHYPTLPFLLLLLLFVIGPQLSIMATPAPTPASSDITAANMRAPTKESVNIVRDYTIPRSLKVNFDEVTSAKTPDGHKTYYQGMMFDGVPGAPMQSAKRQINFDAMVPLNL